MLFRSWAFFLHRRPARSDRARAGSECEVVKFEKRAAYAYFCPPSKKFAHIGMILSIRTQFSNQWCFIPGNTSVISADNRADHASTSTELGESVESPLGIVRTNQERCWLHNSRTLPENNIWRATIASGFISQGVSQAVQGALVLPDRLLKANVQGSRKDRVFRPDD